MACHIGSDIGTTGTKTVVIDEEGKLLGKALSEHCLRRHRPDTGATLADTGEGRSQNRENGVVIFYYQKED